MRFLIRIILILAILLMAKGLLEPNQPQAYISSPRAIEFVEKVEWQATQIQKAARDLPGAIEAMLKRVFSDEQPVTRAKSV
ncbi:MAG: hypothetical protein GX958_07935 [Desulfitobacterium sp.]|nr:hypothetical protein [Desulfitobacterium sp.]